jgi:hypothetical protein
MGIHTSQICMYAWEYIQANRKIHKIIFLFDPGFENYWIHVIRVNDERTWGLAYICYEGGLTTWTVFSKTRTIPTSDLLLALQDAKSLGFDPLAPETQAMAPDYDHCSLSSF